MSRDRILSGGNCRAWPGCLRNERGAVAVEFAIIMSAAIIGFLGLLIFAGRVIQAESDIATAVQAAARAASLAADESSAIVAVNAAVAANLQPGAKTCEPPQVRYDPPDFGLPTASPADRFVEVEMVCEVRPVFFGSAVEVRSVALEPIDRYRGQR